MKVKFTYTTDFDKVPYDCWRLLDDKIHDGCELKDQLLYLYQLLDENKEPNLTLREIEKSRLILASYDQTLSDIYNILQGWTEIYLHDQNVPVIVSDTEQNK
jgi:hypothetical protein